MSGEGKAGISAIVHTLNEENNIQYCLRALDWVQDVFVVDSGSSDRTVEIARRYTPHVVVRAGSRATLVEQRNWALDNLPLQTEWVFIVDADEVVPPDLATEVAAIVGNPPLNIDGYWCRFKNIFMGRWIKHASMYPSWSLRLFRHRIVRYEDRRVNSHPRVAPGREGFLKGHLWHEDRDGVGAFAARAFEFAPLEAAEYAHVHAGETRVASPVRAIWGSRAERRRWLKLLFIRLPLRPLVLFFYLYIIRGGFLDGYPGLVFSTLKAIQEFYVNLRLWEMRRAQH